MKTIIVLFVWASITMSANAAVLVKHWQTNEIALLPKAPFGGYEPVLLVGRVPNSSLWNVMKLQKFQGDLVWNPCSVKQIKGQRLLKFPTRKQLVVDNFTLNEVRFVETKPFIKPE